MGVGEMIDNARTAVTAAVEAAMKELLETKHLYQSVTVDVNAVIAKALPQPERLHPLDAQSRGNAAAIVGDVARGRWITGPSRDAQLAGTDDDRAPLVFEVVPARMFCTTCKRRERYEVVRAEDVTFDVHRPYQAEESQRPQWPLSDQTYAISMLCQGCKRYPEVILVRRTTAKNRLTLSGRTPMEVAEVNESLPEPEVTFFRDAVLAHQSGRTLAGLFYLRTCIEQFARRMTGETGRRTGQDIMATYGETLPLQLRGMIPSFSECYDRISDALHAARADAVVFDDMRGKIAQHFAFRAAARV